MFVFHYKGTDSVSTMRNGHPGLAMSGFQNATFHDLFIRS